jgi:hypothetical protein
MPGVQQLPLTYYLPWFLVGLSVAPKEDFSVSYTELKLGAVAARLDSKLPAHLIFGCPGGFSLPISPGPTKEDTRLIWSRCLRLLH